MTQAIGLYGTDSLGYDAAGNLTARTLGKTTQLSLSYDADGRPAGAASEGYIYDGFGERVAIGMPGAGCIGICSAVRQKRCGRLSEYTAF